MTDHRYYCTPRTQKAIAANKLTEEEVLTLDIAKLKALPLMGYATVQDILKYRDQRQNAPTFRSTPLLCSYHTCGVCSESYWKPVGFSKGWNHCPLCGG